MRDILEANMMENALRKARTLNNDSIISSIQKLLNANANDKSGSNVCSSVNIDDICVKARGLIDDTYGVNMFRRKVSDNEKRHIVKWSKCNMSVVCNYKSQRQLHSDMIFGVCDVISNNTVPAILQTNVYDPYKYGEHTHWALEHDKFMHKPKLVTLGLTMYDFVLLAYVGNVWKTYNYGTLVRTLCMLGSDNDCVREAAINGNIISKDIITSIFPLLER